MNLAESIKEVIRNVPVYKGLYGQCSNDTSTELTKKDVSQNFPYNFMTDSLALAIKNDLVEYTTTSGTTSDRMQIVRKIGWWKEEYIRTSHHNNFLEKFYRKSDGKKAILTTAICSNTVCHLKASTREDRIVGNTLYLNSSSSPFLWSVEDIRRMIDEINDFCPEYVDADPYYLAIFFMKIQEYNLDMPRYMPEFITLSYEFVPINCRKYIEKALGVPVFNLYGATEAGYITCECEHGNLHSIEELAEYGFVPFGRGEVYSLRITSLKNQYMPLINYKVGDLVSLKKAPEDQCTCGAKGRVVVDSLLGREKDAYVIDQNSFLTVGDLDRLMGIIPNVYLYQLDVSCFPRLTLKYCVFSDKEAISDSEKQTILEGIEIYLGKKVALAFKKVPEISSEMSGKFRLIVW